MKLDPSKKLVVSFMSRNEEKNCFWYSVMKTLSSHLWVLI